MTAKVKNRISISELKCERCGEDTLKVLQNENRTGLYCEKCGTFVKWLTRKKDIREAYSRFINKDDITGKAIKRVVKYGKQTTIRCEKCNCLLYSSTVGAPLGQFDLIDASFCPQCGVEFIESQKTFSKNKTKTY